MTETTVSKAILQLQLLSMLWGWKNLRRYDQSLILLPTLCQTIVHFILTTMATNTLQ